MNLDGCMHLGLEYCYGDTKSKNNECIINIFKGSKKWPRFVNKIRKGQYFQYLLLVINNNLARKMIS